MVACSNLWRWAAGMVLSVRSSRWWREGPMRSSVRRFFRMNGAHRIANRLLASNSRRQVGWKYEREKKERK